MKKILHLFKDETPKGNDIFDIILEIKENKYFSDLFKDIDDKKKFLLNRKTIKMIFKNKKLFMKFYIIKR